MPKALDYDSLIGKEYNGIKVISFCGRLNNNRMSCEALCVCDHVFITDFQNLKNGHTKGCFNCRREKLRASKITHGMTISHKPSKLYNSWRGMKERCINPNHKNYALYGGRGISICDEWQSAEAFISWALANGYKDGLSIERLNNDGNYEPSNCLWVTMSTQARNRRETKNKTSGICGIYHDTRNGCDKYRPYICVCGKNKWLGGYDTLESAIEARRAAEKKYWDKE